MSPSGGDGGAGARQEEEERRKAQLRERIDRLYGIGDQIPITTPVVTTTKKKSLPFGKFVGPIEGAISYGDSVSTTGGEVIGYEPDLEAQAARAAMEAENTKLGEATRSYYTDQLGDQYGEAERNTRFKLARQGLLGGSEDIYQQGDVREDRDLGATRVDEAVRRAVSNLVTQREQERLNAINLTNAGAGESAVSAAQAGLRNSLENVSSQQKADLFGDLFTGAADVRTGNNLAEQQAALLGRYRDRLSTFFPARSSTSGRVTPSA